MYEFYIDKTRLPVTPGEISFSNGANIDVVDLANGEKITRWVGRELETITFKASFPYRRYGSFVDSLLREPSDYINKFMYLMQNGIAFEFVMFDHRPMNMKYSIELNDDFDDRTQYEFSESLSNPALVKTMYIQSLQRTDSAENGSEPELEFTLLEWAEKTTFVYSSKAKEIDVVVDNPSELILLETNDDDLIETSESVEQNTRPNNRKNNIPFYHVVPGIIYGKSFSRRTPTRKEYEKMSPQERIQAGFTFEDIATKYNFDSVHGTIELMRMNPQIRAFNGPIGMYDILEMGTVVRLRNLIPGESIRTNGQVMVDTDLIDPKLKDYNNEWIKYR